MANKGKRHPHFTLTRDQYRRLYEAKPRESKLVVTWMAILNACRICGSHEVRLTQKFFRGFPVSRKRQRKYLHQLEEVGLISVDYATGRSPIVTLTNQGDYHMKTKREDEPAPEAAVIFTLDKDAFDIEEERKNG